MPSSYRLSKEWGNCLNVSNFPFQSSLSVEHLKKKIHASKQGCLQVRQYLKDKREPANLKCSKKCQERKGDTFVCWNSELCGCVGTTHWYKTKMGQNKMLLQRIISSCAPQEGTQCSWSMMQTKSFIERENQSNLS